MIKHSLIGIALGAGLTIAPLSFAAPLQDRPQERPQERHAHRSFSFKPEAQQKLRETYHNNFRDRDHVDVRNRTVFRVGGFLPEGWHGRIHAVPETVLAEVGPIPEGLAVGYLDGYAVVYDPATGEIVQVLDVY